MRVRTGIDIVAISDVVATTENDTAMLDECWSEDERRASEGRSDRRAGQWAAKEAVMKVLQTGIGKLSPGDIEIVNRDGMAPRVVLHGRALEVARRLGADEISLSITHERGMAAAVAVALIQDANHG